jgi:hypothetical protein
LLAAYRLSNDAQPSIWTSPDQQVSVNGDKV